MTASITRSGLGATATSQDTFAIVAMDQRNTLERVQHTVGIPDARSIRNEAVGMDGAAPTAYLADEGKRRLDNLVQVIDGRARPYTEVTSR